ncbi:MAG: hypothetical protein M3Y65_19010 [Pseudomonadota bacterium]|nr:hypothetical protein [Pseudomonadota bacterium]
MKTKNLSRMLPALSAASFGTELLMAAVAVPGWSLKSVGDTIHIERADGQWCGYALGAVGPAHQLTYQFLVAALAAAALPQIQSLTAGGALPDAWISEVVGPEVDDLSYGQGYRNGWNDCRTKVAAAAMPQVQSGVKNG